MLLSDIIPSIQPTPKTPIFSSIKKKAPTKPLLHKQKAVMDWDYKLPDPGIKAYNIPEKSRTRHESPCMSAFWRRIPIKINWVKVFELINDEAAHEEHDEKPEEEEEQCQY